jgi:membrane protein DedA with SNARE-associated domain
MGHLDLGWGIVAASAGAMAGDNMSYWLGRLGGLRILHTYCRLTLGSGACVNNALAFYHRFGGIAVVLGRFIVGLRAFLVPLAGSTRMRYGRFMLVDAVGAFVWSSVFIVAGRLLGSQVGGFSRRVRGGSTLLLAAFLIAFLGYMAMKLWKRHRYEAAAADKFPSQGASMSSFAIVARGLAGGAGDQTTRAGCRIDHPDR